MHTLRIALHFLPLALSFRRDFRRWIVWGRPVPRTAEFHRRRAARLVDTLAGLGPTFVKLAQVFASRADLVPEPYVGALGRLLDQVPPVPFPAIAAELAREYGEPHTAVFERLDETPLAAGSLGQVHRARWRGHDVVVKVLRPGIERVVRRDLASARTITRHVERWWPNPHVRGFRMAVEEFERRIGDEMNFVLEAEHAMEIGGSFAGDPRVMVPRVWPEMARPGAMVMSYVEGTRVDRIAPLVAEGVVSPERLVRGVMEIYVRMMLMDGLFHADPHPGNLLVAPDGRIVLLDFGMCVRVPVETRATLVRTVMSAVRKEADGVATGFEELGIVAEGADPAEIRRLVQVLLDLAYSGMAPQDAARVLAEEVMHELYDWPIVLTGEMVYFARAAALIEGLGARHVPDFNAIAFASPIVVRMRHQILRTLQMTGGVSEDDMATTVRALSGQARRIVATAGRELASLLGMGVAQLMAQMGAAGPEGDVTAAGPRAGSWDGAAGPRMGDVGERFIRGGLRALAFGIGAAERAADAVAGAVAAELRAPTRAGRDGRILGPPAPAVPDATPAPVPDAGDDAATSRTR